MIPFRVILLALSLTACSETRRVFDCASPNGQLIATFYTIGGGGAAGSLDEYVSVRPSTSKFDENDWVFTLTHGYDVRLSWTGPQSLEIGYPDSARTSISPTKRADVAINVVPLPSNGGSLADSLKGCIRRAAAPGRPNDR